MMEKNMTHFHRQLAFWGFVFALFCAVVWLLNSVLLPFVLGIGVAYLLNPAVNFLGRVGFGRQAATIVILSGFSIFLALFLALLGPVLYREVAEFVGNIPAYTQRLEVFLIPWAERVQAYLGKGAVEGPQTAGVSAWGGAAVKSSNALVAGLSAGGAFLSNMISVVIVTPFVAFFMMKDWPKVLKWVEDLLPLPYRPTILDLLGKIDKKISGFVRGQITVAALLGAAYAVSLSLLGLQYGFLIGVTAGIINIIPMVGSTVGLLVAVLVAWLQTADPVFTGMVAGVFLTGQAVEGNFLTPKLIGGSVGLHPLWVFFSLMAGGGLFGITGMFLAVPVTASLGVLIGFALERYKESEYFQGHGTVPAASAGKARGRKKNAEQKTPAASA